jgi:hypothetical protein
MDEANNAPKRCRVVDNCGHQCQLPKLVSACIVPWSFSYQPLSCITVVCCTLSPSSVASVTQLGRHQLLAPSASASHNQSVCEGGYLMCWCAMRIPSGFAFVGTEEAVIFGEVLLANNPTTLVALRAVVVASVSLPTFEEPGIQAASS